MSETEIYEKVKPIILNHGLEDKLYTITEFLEPHPPKDLHGVVFDHMRSHILCGEPIGVVVERVDSLRLPPCPAAGHPTYRDVVEDFPAVTA